MGTKNLGYNRWGRNWPEDVSLHLRWPVIMNAVATWPFHWIVERRRVGPSFPTSFDPFPTAEWINADGTFNYWAVLPSPLGEGSVVILRVRLPGTMSEPLGFEWDWIIFNRPGSDYEAEKTLALYTLPLDEITQLQNHSFSIEVASVEDPTSDRAQFNFFKAQFCGQEWPPPEL